VFADEFAAALSSAGFKTANKLLAASPLVLVSALKRVGMNTVQLVEVMQQGAFFQTNWDLVRFVAEHGVKPPAAATTEEMRKEK
jgi:hypothetical protein